MIEVYRPYYDEYFSREAVGQDPLPTDAREIGRVLREELLRRNEHELLDCMETCFHEAEDVLPIGDLLDVVKAIYGVEKMATALQLLYAMQRRGEAIMYEDNDRQRLMVERLRSPNQA